MIGTALPRAGFPGEAREDRQLHASLAHASRPRVPASSQPAEPDLPLTLLDRLLVCRIVPVKAKLAAVQGCLLELEGMSLHGPQQHQLRRRLREMLKLLKEQVSFRPGA
ncbi:MAG TPA: hypothetical protein VKW08_18745 [Xanthobacteraceae bacterium]|jgi:hypothetical protein|nr:hypothetical protein [Xanthobacteraceae bacterium]